MLEFMKLYADMEQLFEPYSQEEKGNLLDAMMAYCFNGEEPNFTGNERFIWPVLRRHFDQCAERAETLRTNAAKGGRSRKQKDSEESKPEPNKTNENQTKPNETKNKLEQEQEQEQEHIQEQEHKQEQFYAPAPATDNVIAFDGSDLTADIRNNQKAQELAARYLPRGRTPMEFDPRVGALAEDIGTHGAEKVEAALKEAARCDNRGGVSIAFYRTILGNLGKEKPPNKAAAGDYQHRKYTEADFKALEVDLDAL